MPRVARASEGGLVHHVLNRGNARARIFDDDADYQGFEDILFDGLSRVNIARRLAGGRGIRPVESC